MKKYRFKIGQVVQASETSSKLPPGHLRVVRHLMPTPSGVPRYCVKDETDETECVAEQHQIEPASGNLQRQSLDQRNLHEASR